MVMVQMLDADGSSGAQLGVHPGGDVGERLPEEARRIHYGEAEARDIRGSASADEVESLLEEGILVLPVPPAEEDLH